MSSLLPSGACVDTALQRWSACTVEITILFDTFASNVKFETRLLCEYAVALEINRSIQSDKDMETMAERATETKEPRQILFTTTRDIGRGTNRALVATPTQLVFGGWKTFDYRAHAVLVCHNRQSTMDLTVCFPHKAFPSLVPCGSRRS